MYCEQTSSTDNIDNYNEYEYDNEYEGEHEIIVLHSTLISVSKNMYYNFLIMDSLGILSDVGEYGFYYHNVSSINCKSSPITVKLESNRILKFEKIVTNHKKEDLSTLRLPDERKLNKHIFYNKFAIYSFIIGTSHILRDVTWYIIKLYCDHSRDNDSESIQELLDSTPKSLLNVNSEVYNI
jgi:hypothetical protein